jgi:hypothetical protein
MLLSYVNRLIPRSVTVAAAKFRERPIMVVAVGQQWVSYPNELLVDRDTDDYDVVITRSVVKLDAASNRPIVILDLVGYGGKPNRWVRVPAERTESVLKNVRRITVIVT